MQSTTNRTLTTPHPPARPLTLPLLLLATLLAAPAPLPAATQSKKIPVVPKWTRFEHAFKSSTAYHNPLQDASLTVLFTSPFGETNQVDGFWDGGRTWRVRFSPNQAGIWTFKTSCSDPRNHGLNNQRGQFLCTAPIGLTPFHRHGPVRIAPDHRHFQYADGTPFFWLADSVWDGARLATPNNWELYAQVRSAQKFTVAQWTVAPGPDAKKQSALTGFADHIGVNPAFFQRLDAKLDTLSRAGILSAIVPLSDLAAQNQPGLPLPDDQAALLVRYLLARWGAEPVVWLLALDADNHATLAARWKKIGQSVFAGTSHAPVLLYSGKSLALLDEFRSQTWVDAFACRPISALTQDALKWTFAGPFAREWTNQPPRPIIPFTPPENAPATASHKRFTAGDVRHAACWSLLLVPPAGLSYAACGVADWDTSTAPPAQKPAPGANLPLWQRSLFLPGAKQMTLLAGFITNIDFWLLRPQPNLLAAQPGDASPERYIAAAAAQNKTLAAAYVPQERTLELNLDALPPSPNVSWFNPRSGASSPAVAVVGEHTCQFPTPDPGDWLLLLKTPQSPTRPLRSPSPP